MKLSTENAKFLKTIAYLALPIILQDTLNMLVNMVDNLMVGSLGLHAVTAVGLANLVFFLYSLVVFGVCSGSAIYFGQFWGKNDTTSIHRTMGLALISGLSLSLLVTAAVLLAAPQIMMIYSDGNPLVIELGVTYLHAIAPVYVLVAVIIAINASLRSIGKTRFPLATTTVSLLCNIVLNALFILVLKMGVAGAAYATVIARSVELCVQLFLIRRYKLPVWGPWRNYIAFNASFARNYYILVLPVVANEFLWALGTMLYSVIYKTTGTEGQGAQQIASVVQNLFIVMCHGAGNGCSIMIAKALGANERDHAIDYARKSIILAICISMVMSLAMAVFAPAFIGLYNVPEEVKASALRICLVIAVACPFKVLNFTAIIGILRSGGDTRFCMVIDGLTIWLVSLPLLLLGAYVFHLPIHWLVALTIVEEVVKLVFCLRRVYGNRWAKNLVEHM